MAKKFFKKTALVFLGLMVALSLVVFIWLGWSLRQDLDLEHVQVIKPQLALPPLELVSETRQSIKRFPEHQWTILAFGFTRCPDICPTALGLMSQIAAYADRLGGPVGFAFVSVDSFDSSERLLAYTEHFHKDIVGYGGTPEALQVLSKSLWTTYEPASQGQGAHHSTRFYVISPQNKWVAYFEPRVNKAEDLAKELAMVMRQQL